MVPKERLELSRCCHHWILSPARLPVPPLRHDCKCGGTGRKLNLPTNYRPVRRSHLRRRALRHDCKCGGTGRKLNLSTNYRPVRRSHLRRRGLRLKSIVNKV